LFTPIPNHVEQALARLISQYQDAVGFNGFITALVNPCQDIEGVLNDLNVKRQLAVATGVQLDNIGTIVGLARPPGATDDQYRNDLYAEIKINVSEGQPEQAIQTFQLFTGAQLVLLDEHFPAEVSIESEIVFPDQPSVDMILQIMQQVLPAGVRCDGIVEFDPTNPFAFDGSLFGGGFGSDTDPTAGGLFATLRLRDGQFAFDGDDPTAEGLGSTDDPLVGGEFLIYDTLPIFYSASVPSTGDSVTVQLMGVALAPIIPLTGITGFVVKVNSVPATISSAVSQFNSQILLAISSPLIHSGDTVTVAYTPGNVTDSHANALAAFVDTPVTNNSTM
jgi:hypothetical protein